MAQEYNSIIDAILPSIPKNRHSAIRTNVPYIINALRDEGIFTPKVLSYALSTIEHETAGTFQPIEEYGGRQQAIKLGYGGGEDYFGRGYIQLTHLGNYQEIGERIGLGDKLAKNPELALEPEIAAKILASFFKNRGVAKLAEKGDFVRARTPVNPDTFGSKLATNANKYLSALNKITPQQWKDTATIVTEKKIEPRKPITEIDLGGTKEVGVSAKPITPAVLPQPRAPIAEQVRGAVAPIATSSAKPQAGPAPITQQPMLSAMQSPTVRTNMFTPLMPKPVMAAAPTAPAMGGYSPTPSYTPAPPMATMMGTHIVKAGETPGGIAQQYTGNWQNWKQFWSGDPRKMPVGTRIPVPSVAGYV